MAHGLESSKRLTRYASDASWRARRQMDYIHKSDLKSNAISLIRRWKEALWIKSVVDF
jgi:hypothetical protein